MKSLISFVIICFLSAQSWVFAITVDFSATRVCLGNITTLINTSIPGDSVQYRSWDLDGDGRFVDAYDDIVQYQFPYPGAHEVGLRIVTLSGEARAIYKLVMVGNLSVDFLVQNGCISQPVQFFNRSTIIGDVINDYTWDFGDGSAQSYEKDPTHQYSAPGTFNVTLTVNSAFGCSVISQPKTITIGDAVVIDLKFSGDTVFVKGGSVTAYLPPGLYDSVLWSTNDTTESIIITKGGGYWVRAFVGGCYAEKSFHIRVEEYGSTPVIMTMITPNGDGMNDKWQILNLFKVGPCEVNMFNRLGENILSISDYLNDWEGTYNGKALANDTYYYFVRCLDNILLQGTVNILK
ncbi:MAG: PKD domain-containing protein [Bacteroidota bacterium]